MLSIPAHCSAGIAGAQLPDTISSDELTLDWPENLADLSHLVPLERQRLLAVEFCFVALEYRTERKQLSVDTSCCPEIYRDVSTEPRAELESKRAETRRQLLCNVWSQVSTPEPYTRSSRPLYPLRIIPLARAVCAITGRGRDHRSSPPHPK